MEAIILASQSPRRKQLLQSAEIQFEVMVSDTDETYPTDLPIQEIPVFIAREKANVVQKKLDEQQTIATAIIAADTVVVLNNQIIGKPVDRTNAIEILQSLSGKTHQVITGVVVKHSTEEIAFSETTLVHFNSLSSNDIIHYIDTYKPYDKAGAYAIQEWIGIIGISKIEGDFYNVMGLPINRLVTTLKMMNIL